jgi:hypothetical protein
MRSNMTNVKTANAVAGVDKKVYIAAALIAIMGFMWVRVFVNKKSGPDQASAQDILTVAADQTKSHTTTLEYVALPMIEGRNDTLAGDMFALKPWNSEVVEEPEQAPEPTVEVVVEDTRAKWESTIRKVAAGLQIEALLVGQNGQKSEVFIENKILAKGSILTVKNSGQKYDFIVADIGNNYVELRCDETTVTLKMAQQDDVSN